MKKTFKQLVYMAADVQSEHDADVVAVQVERSFESGTITFEDHEILYKLLYK